MIPLPAKRRKSNSSAAIPVEAPNVEHASSSRDGKPQRTSRSSFRSPTKASVARSQPELLSRVLGRSVAERALRSENRGFELHNRQGDEKKTALGAAQSSLNPDISLPPPKSKAGTKPPLAAGGRQTQGEDSWGSQPSKLNNGTVRRSARRALFASQRSSATVKLASGTGGLSESQNKDDDEGEPELPPTPTQLRVQKLSIRSRTLTSRSPSLRLQERNKRTLEQQAGPSHLEQDIHRTQGEDQDSGPLANIPQPEEIIPKELREKRKLRDELAAQLERLKNDVAILEDCGQRLEQPNTFESMDEDLIKRLLLLLTTDNPSCAPPPPKPQPVPISSVLSYLLPFSAPKHIPNPIPEPPITPPPENPFALEPPPDPLPYLTLFAPLSLSTHNTTTSQSSSDSPQSPSRLVQIHHLTLSPPPGFPSSIYKVPITLETDPEQQKVLSISIPKSSTALDIANIPTQLRRWMDTRLSNRLLGQDVSGLSWGVCRYWEACVSRTKIWIRLEKLQSIVNDGGYSGDTSSNEDIEPEQHPPRALIPHLDRSSFLFSTHKSEKYQILVSCPVEIDLWTSEPFLEPDICISSQSARGSGQGKVEIEARRVFWSMLNHRGADVDIACGKIVRAVEAVVRVLYGQE
ncbi:predicted protein [Uncinocarpus reesii 1704]|uniref:Uncharacterized protein n=1 Tax=Uncinocarpus reesii (strain UAMH 1704) TaxID=336963 RepID=C4JH48_UNCRE|nr:uncharacterized protein UREG_02621 [Uncinocarpus reesii 1704]EEP77772.1 predicted protein [Uncinocarpus reesii 1704]